jgi:hypothetical protein
LQVCGRPNLGGDTATVRRRCATVARCGAGKGKSKKVPTKPPRRARAQKSADGSRTNKKAEGLAMMKRGIEQD